MGWKLIKIRSTPVFFWHPKQVRTPKNRCTVFNVAYLKWSRRCGNGDGERWEHRRFAEISAPSGVVRRGAARSGAARRAREFWSGAKRADFSSELADFPDNTESTPKHNFSFNYLTANKSIPSSLRELSQLPKHELRKMRNISGSNSTTFLSMQAVRGFKSSSDINFSRTNHRLGYFSSPGHYTNWPSGRPSSLECTFYIFYASSLVGHRRPFVESQLLTTIRWSFAPRGHQRYSAVYLRACV